ncbi:hypothetical protein M9991_05795 [Chryseobacterium gallinarum]|uniref:hypothetical protein n=1 Tax=Chryseobacterium gallinarum TaxID=1324352 RepID=UPI0020248395|nr:hypothetical protein [Chryseobacterium gallinarum]MCL8536374.1 hypothetical protein [Chryseobacterium gallinarum]
MKKINTSLMLIIFSLAFPQVGISKNKSAGIHSKAILQVDGQYGGKSWGMLLPEVSTPENLPLYNAAPDEEMTGMMMFEKTHATFYSYDGTQWNNEPAPAATGFNKKQSRFLSTANEETSVVCVLLGCGRHVGLGFSAPVDGIQSYNNLNITRETAIVPGGGLYGDKSFDNAKFVINEPGVYDIYLNIPSKTGGAVSLTSGPQYQLRAYLKQDDGSYSEAKLSTFFPDYYGILGIGGDTNTAAFTTTRIRLKAGDYIISRIHSPLATVSVVVTLTAATGINIAKYYPREIMFTKISD